MVKGPTEEEFEAWRDHPITQWVMAAYRALAEEQKAAWLQQSWDAENNDREALLVMKTRADSYLAIVESGHDAYTAAHEGNDK